MRHALSGVVASKGLALGRARIREPHIIEIEERLLTSDEIEDEVSRLLDALSATRAELFRLREQLQGALAQELGEFLDLHALLLDDPDLVVGLTDLIRTGHYSASYALKLQRDRLVAVFDSIDDPYLRSRREDIDHVIGRVQAALHRGLDENVVIGLSGDILITDSVAPAEMAQLSERGIVAILVSHGSPLSHSAILARSLGLPMMLVSADTLFQISDGTAIIVDANQAQIIIDPNPSDLLDFRKREKLKDREKRALDRLRSAPTRTLDDQEIELFANAESPDEVSRAFRLGASGIGLYRTEFLFLQGREPPNEEEQVIAYRDAVLGMNGRPVTLRTLDLGADKADKAGITAVNEPNPALGLRGVRLSLARPSLFREQLRAMLRASAYGPIRILIPMVTRREEMLTVHALVRDCERELRQEGHHLADHIPIGAMIEVPSAALSLPTMISTMDFVSIGTNDLVQYLLATDRSNDALGELFSPLYPAVIRVLHEIISCCKQAKKPLSICGEIASDVRFTRLLLALGLTQFSMHPGGLLEVRAAIRDSSLRPLRRRSNSLLRAVDREALERLVSHL